MNFIDSVHAKKMPDFEVLKCARAGERWAVWELGYRDLPEGLAILRDVASREAPASLPSAERWPRLHAAWAAKVAMVQRGDRTYLPEIMSGLTSSDLVQVARSIEALGEIGNCRAAFNLGPFLEDSRPVPVVPHGKMSDWAGHALSRLFPDVSLRLKAALLTKPIDGAAWIPWWNENRDRFPEGL